MIKVTVAVCVIPAPVPRMINVEVEDRLMKEDVILKVLEPDPWEIDGGLNVALVPAGKPDTLNVTVDVKLP
jgi:hypothetical protein